MVRVIRRDSAAAWWVVVKRCYGAWLEGVKVRFRYYMVGSG